MSKMRPIDYRNTASRLSDRARTNKSNSIAIAVAIAIVVGFLTYTIFGL